MLYSLPHATQSVSLLTILKMFQNYLLKCVSPIRVGAPRGQEVTGFYIPVPNTDGAHEWLMNEWMNPSLSLWLQICGFHYSQANCRAIVGA